MKMYQEKSAPKAKHKYWLALPLVALCLFVSACEKQELQIAENEISSKEKQEVLTHIPQDFQDKIKELKVKYPNNKFYFQNRESKYLQKDLAESDEDVNYWSRIVYHRPLSKQEDYNYMKGEFENSLQYIIEKYGSNSMQAKILKQRMENQPLTYEEPMTGYIYMHDISKESGDDFWEDEDNTVYTEVDEYPNPREAANFYEEMFKLVKFPESMKAVNPSDLKNDLLLEMVVTKTGNLVKVNIVEGIKIALPEAKDGQNMFLSMLGGQSAPPYEAVNGAVFRAFTTHSELRGWKAGMKNGKRVDTKIRFKIPVEGVKKLIGC